MKSRLSIFWIRLTNWEYWPWYIVYFPVFIYWLWCGLKTRAIFWISAVNPGFEYGGIIGDSKHKILSKIPAQNIPKGFLIMPSDSIADVGQKMLRAELTYPIILKPDVGERGFHVELISNRNELETHLLTNKETTLAQEYIDLPVELGIFYYRFPNDEKGIVSSIVQKGLLKVIGDGASSIRQLMEKSNRAKQQINRIASNKRIDLDHIPYKEEEVLLEPIGNHNRGTMFLNGETLISPALTKRIDRVSKEIDGFYYGRFDIRCASIEALCDNKFMVMELNGAASEPAHIYAPNYPLLKAYRVLLNHWKVLYKISKWNHQQGVPYMSFGTGLEAIKKSRFTR